MQSKEQLAKSQQSTVKEAGLSWFRLALLCFYQSCWYSHLKSQVLLSNLCSTSLWRLKPSLLCRLNTISSLCGPWIQTISAVWHFHHHSSFRIDRGKPSYFCFIVSHDFPSTRWDVSRYQLPLSSTFPCASYHEAAQWFDFGVGHRLS